MKNYLVKNLLVGMLVSMGSTGVYATVITFDDIVPYGTHVYSADGNGDGVKDVVFSTTEHYGFYPNGPGDYMSYVDQPGLGGTTLLNPDLRVDFLDGAVDYLKFAFAVDGDEFTTDTTASIEIYDTHGTMLASALEYAYFTLPDGIHPSNYPEAIADVEFAGVASYMLIDFAIDNSSDPRYYLLDNFEGNFNGNDIPEPTSISLLALGFAVLGFSCRKLNK